VSTPLHKALAERAQAALDMQTQHGPGWSAAWQAQYPAAADGEQAQALALDLLGGARVKPAQVTQLAEQIQLQLRSAATDFDGLQAGSADQVADKLQRRADLRASQYQRQAAQLVAMSRLIDDGAAQYEWRTQRDGRVRPEHAQLHGVVFDMATGHPSEGHPGDAPGCRCEVWPVSTRGDAAAVACTRFDAIDIDTARGVVTDAGFLEIKGAVIARAGVLTYRRADGTTFGELRDPAVMHSAAALQTYEGKPILLGDHPTDSAGCADLLRADNVSAHPPVGAMRNVHASHARSPRTGAQVAVTRADVLLWSPAAIEQARAGVRQFSVGYRAQVVEESGTWQGAAYTQRQITDTGNHLLQTQAARAGDITEFRLDSSSAVLFTAAHAATHAEDNMAQFTIDGVSGDVDAALVPLLQSLVQTRTDQTTQLQLQQAQVEELTGQVKVLSAEQTARGDDTQRIAQAVKDRLQLQTQAAPLLPPGYTYSSKTDDQIRTDAVAHYSAVTDLQGAELAGAYKAAIAQQARADGHRSALASATRPAAPGTVATPIDTTNAYARSCAALNTAFKSAQ